jgi:voltage-gated potassium channel
VKKVVIFGYNRLAVEAVTRLDKERYQVLIVEPNETLAACAIANGFDTKIIDFRNDDELLAIGIGSDVDVIFCFFPHDGDNVFLTISARALDKNLMIIAVIENHEAGDKLIAAGANKIIDPYEICGRKIHELIKKPDMTNILDHTVFGRHDLNMAEIEIPVGSYLQDTYVYDLNLSLNTQHNLILIGIVDKELGEDLHFSINEKQHKLDVGDILVVMGPSKEIRAFKKQVYNATDDTKPCS